jgi:hypothetical protein
MIRLSVSDLETYRYWKDREDSSLEELVSQLQGVVEPTPAMVASRAFHLALENLTPATEGLVALRQDGYTFEFDCDGDFYLPPIRELKAEVPWVSTSGPVTLVGKVDGMYGLTVRDYKLSERFEADRYTDSFQWRAYLAMFKCHRFVYDVFQCSYDRYDPMKVKIYEIHHFGLDRYPEMLLDLDRVIDEVAAVVVKHVPQKVTP